MATVKCKKCGGETEFFRKKEDWTCDMCEPSDSDVKFFASVTVSFHIIILFTIIIGLLFAIGSSWNN